jgi:hypothetical protein
MKIKKWKAISFLTILFILTFGINLVSFADDPEIIEVDTTPDSFSKGSTFSLDLTFANDARVVPSTVRISDTTDFVPSDGIYEPNIVGDVVTFNLKYIGNNNVVPFLLTFTDGGGAETKTVSVTLPGANIVDESDNDDDDIFDPTIYKPSLKTSSATTIPTFNAGTKINLEIPLENLSTNEAKTIEISFENELDSFPFKPENLLQTFSISSLKKGEVKKATFPVEIPQSVKSGTYLLKMKTVYKNVFGSDFETILNYYITINNTYIEPSVGIIDYSLDKDQIDANGDYKLTLNLKNAGSMKANSIRVVLSGFDKDNFILNKDVDTKNVSYLLGQGNGVINYNIHAQTNITPGNHELIAHIYFLDDQNNEYEKESKIYLNALSNDSSGNISVLNLKRPEVVSSNQNFNISFDLQNDYGDLKNVEVSLEYPSNVAVPKTSPKFYIKDFVNGTTISKSFSMSSKQEISTEYYDFYVVVRYLKPGASEWTEIREYAGTFFSGNDGALGRPKIIVANYNFGGFEVLAGQEFDLSLDLFNTSSVEGVKNIKVSLKADEGVFSPVEMASSFFIDSIAPNEIFNKVIKLKAKNDASVKPYNIVLTMEYEDSKGNAYDSQKNPYKEEETLAINVNQPIRLETSEIVPPYEAYINQPVSIYMDFFNTGKSTLYNLMVKVEGDFTVQGSNYYVGNFEAGRSDYFDMSIIPTLEGMAMGKVVFTFEDANGVPGSIEKEFSMNVMGEMIFEPEVPGEEFPIEPGMPVAPNKPMIYIIIGGILTLMGGLWIWKVRKDKIDFPKVELEEDEDE